jgi:hypothetical protein
MRENTNGVSNFRGTVSMPIHPRLVDFHVVKKGGELQPSPLHISYAELHLAKVGVHRLQPSKAVHKHFDKRMEYSGLSLRGSLGLIILQVL